MDVYISIWSYDRAVMLTICSDVTLAEGSRQLLSLGFPKKWPVYFKLPRAGLPLWPPLPVDGSGLNYTQTGAQSPKGGTIEHTVQLLWGPELSDSNGIYTGSFSFGQKLNMCI